MRTPGTTTSAAILLLAAEAIAFYWRILFQHERYQTPWDFQGYYYPLAEFFTKSLMRGDWPWWEPYTYSGQPLFANINAQVFYPPWLALTGLNLLLGGGHPKYMLELNLVLHVVAGGFGAWLLGRTLGAGFWSAMVAGTVYQLSGFHASQPQYLGAICSAAWLPFSWTAVVKLAANERPGRAAVLLAASLAMSILAGAPCIFMVAYVTVCALAAMLIATGQARWTIVPWTVAGMTLGGMLAAIQVLPTAELTSLSAAAYRYQAVVAGGGVPPMVLWSLIVPNYWNVFEIGKVPWTLRWNPTFFYLFCGWTGISGAALAIPIAWRRALPLAATGALSAFWMFGENTRAGKALYMSLPVQLRNPVYSEYAMVGLMLAIATLAAMGLSALLDRRPALAALAAICSAVELVATSANRPFNVTDVVDGAPIVSYDRFEWENGLPALVRERTDTAIPPWRVEIHEASNTWLWASPVMEIPFAPGNDAFALRRYIAVRGLLTGQTPGLYQRRVAPTRLDTRVSDLFGAGYLLTTADPPESLTGRGQWVLDGKLPVGHSIYRKTSPLPRFYLAGSVRYAAGLDEALAAMKAADFDPAKVTIVEGPAAPVTGGEPVRVVRYSADEIELETSSAGPAFLATSEIWYPGWGAEVDGVSTPVRIVNGAFRGLELPAGTHRVRFQFSPRIVWAGAAIGLLAALVCGRLYSRS